MDTEDGIVFLQMENLLAVPGHGGRYPTENQNSMKYILIAMTLVLLCSCTQQPGGGYDATYQQQLDGYNRQTEQAQQQLDQTQKQLAQTQKQQDEAGRLLQRSIDQIDRQDALLDRWEEQADRQDKVLDTLERVLTRENADSKSPTP